MAEERKGFFRRLAEGLTKTRNNIVSGMDAIFSGFSDIDDDFYDEIEEILVMGDIGINATTAIIANLKQKVKEQHIKNPQECKELLINSIKEQMQVGETAYEFEHRTSVVLVIGVTVSVRLLPLENWQESSKTRGEKSFWRQQIRSARQQASSSPSGRTAQAWRLSAAAKVQIRHLWFTMLYVRQKPEKQTFC